MAYSRPSRFWKHTRKVNIEQLILCEVAFGALENTLKGPVIRPYWETHNALMMLKAKSGR